MPEPATPDHDQRLKVLLKEFFEQFLRCFFPVWAARFDFSTLSWLDKEIFPDPPRGVADACAVCGTAEGLEYDHVTPTFAQIVDECLALMSPEDIATKFGYDKFQPGTMS